MRDLHIKIQSRLQCSSNVQTKTFEGCFEKYLAQFGYLKGPSRETQNLSNQEDLTRAIKALQKAGNIPQTGVPDRRTEELMARPRCGNTDEFVPHGAMYRSPYDYTRARGNEPHIRKKRYTLATSKWQRTNLTFSKTCWALTPDTALAEKMLWTIVPEMRYSSDLHRSSSHQSLYHYFVVVTAYDVALERR
ncbi:matrix metalloproteinase [Elysia marginata]|uniref:Matrix metalloproteinase n=1 Tax=Elysia marginata TaxID=1093978 RepID=A0AAV4ELR3_9GAST|nr:matrix metalloproteinase [Elysia marginata]